MRVLDIAFHEEWGWYHLWLPTADLETDLECLSTIELGQYAVIDHLAGGKKTHRMFESFNDNDVILPSAEKPSYQAVVKIEQVEKLAKTHPYDFQFCDCGSKLTYEQL